jgi:hypothetical protein
MDSLKPKDVKVKHPKFGHVIFYGVTPRQREILDTLDTSQKIIDEKNIKVQILDPTGVVINSIDTKYPIDQLDRFLSQNRIVVVSDNEPVSFFSKEHRWNPLDTDKK